MADRRDRRDGGFPPQLAVKDPMFGEPKPTGGGVFEMGVTVVVWTGKQLALDADYQFLVNGIKYGNPAHVDPAGRASGKLRLSGECPSIAIQVQLGDQDRLFPLRDVELPKLKRKLEVMGTMVHGEELEVVLRRVGKDGKGEDGEIAAWDFRIEEKGIIWRFLRWDVKATYDGYVTIHRPILNEPRQVAFFLPDDKEVKVTVAVPAKQITEEKKEKEVAVSPFRRGQEVAERLFGKRHLRG